VPLPLAAFQEKRMKTFAGVLAGIVFLAFAARNTAASDTVFDGASGPEARSVSELAAAQAAPGVGPAAEVDARMWVEVRAADAGARSRLASMGMSIEELGSGTALGIVDPESLSAIEDAGFTVIRRVFLRTFGPEDFPAEDGIYHNFDELQAELSSLASAAPDLVSFFSLGSSWQGRDLLGLRLSAGPEAKPGIAFFGAHHAREHLSVEVPLLLARYLIENRDHPAIRPLLETRDIYFVPMVNPDGAEYDIESGRYRWQRKNMRANADGSVGVDLNRNFGHTWGGVGASDRPGSDTYRGPAAFSEPESQAVRDFIRARPDIRIMVSYHSYGEMVLYPWGHLQSPVPDTRAHQAFKTMASVMGDMTGYRDMQSADLYPASGDTCDWAWGERGVFCFTFELSPGRWGGGGFYPGPDAVASTFEANIDPALYMIGLADDPYRAGDALARLR